MKCHLVEVTTEYPVVSFIANQLPQNYSHLIRCSTLSGAGIIRLAFMLPSTLHLCFRCSSATHCPRMRFYGTPQVGSSLLREFEVSYIGPSYPPPICPPRLCDLAPTAHTVDAIVSMTSWHSSTAL